MRKITKPIPTQIPETYILYCSGKYTISRYENMLSTWLPCKYKGETMFFDTSQEASDFLTDKNITGITIQDA